MENKKFNWINTIGLQEVFAKNGYTLFSSDGNNEVYRTKDFEGSFLEVRVLVDLMIFDFYHFSSTNNEYSLLADGYVIETPEELNFFLSKNRMANLLSKLINPNTKCIHERFFKNNSASLSTEKDKKVSEIINDLTPITSQLNDLIKKHNLSTTDLVFNQSTDGIRFFIDYDNITRVLCRYKMPTVDVLLYAFELIEKQENSLTYRKDIGHNCFLELEVNFNIFSLYFNTHIGDSRLCQFYRFTINSKEEFEFILKKSMTSYAFNELNNTSLSTKKHKYSLNKEWLFSLGFFENKEVDGDFVYNGFVYYDSSVCCGFYLYCIDGYFNLYKFHGENSFGKRLMFELVRKLEIYNDDELYFLMQRQSAVRAIFQLPPTRNF